jgi:hypothetical protein
MAHDVFVSYSVKDKTTAEAICASLGRSIWAVPRRGARSRQDSFRISVSDEKTRAPLTGVLVLSRWSLAEDYT